MNIQTITNVSDCVPLYLPHSLYLKPLAKFNISVTLPSTNKLGKTISNYDIMDKLTSAIKPDKCLVMKVSKSTLEFIRFEAELEDRSKLRQVLQRIDGLKLKLVSFNEPFKVRASESKDDFPTRHDWDSFFRDARNMDEMKPGERPDTIHISNLPIRWFCPRHLENDENVKPSENIFKRIFEKFGSIRCVDIPICDPYRSQMKTEITGMKTFNFDQEVMFEGYIQFSEYAGFVKAMDEFRGMKLVRKSGEKNQAVNISVTFDKTKHLSDASIKRRHIVRDRLISKERAKEEEENRRKKEEQERLERERKKQEELKQKELEHQRQREEKRKEKHLKKLREKGQLEISQKIRQEEKKLMIAQRKLESIRILEALFERIKLKESQLVKVKLEDSGKTSIKRRNSNNEKEIKVLGKNDLRNKLVNKYKSAHEEILQKQKTKLEQVKGKTGLLALLDGDKKLSNRSPSINTISSDDSVLSDSHQISQKKKKKKKKKEESSSSRSSSSSSSSSEEKSIEKKKTKMLNPFKQMYNPEMPAAEWLQMGFYPYPPIFPGLAGIRPPIFPNPAVFRGGFNPFRGRGRGRGRGGRGVGPHNTVNNYHYDNEQYYKYYKKISGTGNDYDNYKDDHDHRRSRSYSRTRSRTRSRSRSRHRSSRTRRSRSRRSRSRGRRSRSRSRTRSRTRSRSHSRSRDRSRSRKRTNTKSRSRSKQKLASTRRSRSPESSSTWSRSKSRSKGRSWSRDLPSSSSQQDKNAIHPQKLVRSAKEIQRSVQQKLHDRLREEEEGKKIHPHLITRDEAEVMSRKRSVSVDSSKFISPKRKEKSTTPERDWMTSSSKERRRVTEAEE